MALGNRFSLLYPRSWRRSIRKRFRQGKVETRPSRFRHRRDDALLPRQRQRVVQQQNVHKEVFSAGRGKRQAGRSRLPFRRPGADSRTDNEITRGACFSFRLFFITYESELLVSIAIQVILAALLLSAISARRSSRDGFLKQPADRLASG